MPVFDGVIFKTLNRLCFKERNWLFRGMEILFQQNAVDWNSYMIGMIGNHSNFIAPAIPILHVLNCMLTKLKAENLNRMS